jgi:hypothetical protein
MSKTTREGKVAGLVRGTAKGYSPQGTLPSWRATAEVPALCTHGATVAREAHNLDIGRVRLPLVPFEIPEARAL